jgi:hypothetical protein
MRKIVNKHTSMQILEQVKRNSVAIISLVVALSSLGYNTWRNEATENNRNIRTASFEVLKSLGELQIIADHAHYEKDQIQGNPITGWGRVLLIRDLCHVISDPAAQSATALHKTWGNNWSTLGKQPGSIEAITKQIDAVRQDVLAALETLD